MAWRPNQPSFATDYRLTGSNYPMYNSAQPLYPPNPVRNAPNYNNVPKPFMSAEKSMQEQQWQEEQQWLQQNSNFQQGNSRILAPQTNGGFQNVPHQPSCSPQAPQSNGYPTQDLYGGQQLSNLSQPQFASPMGYQPQQRQETTSYSSERRSSTTYQQKQPNREVPDMDEDFPSFKDLRSMFTKGEQDNSQTRVSWQTNSLTRKPPTAQKPPRTQLVHTVPLKGSPESHRTIPIQINTGQPLQIIQHSEPNVTYEQTTQSYDEPGNESYATKTERQYETRGSGVNTITKETKVVQRSVSSSVANRPQQFMEGFPGERQTMTVNVNNSPSLNASPPSPKVVITSNSPRSPQKAVYRGDSSDWADRAVTTPNGTSNQIVMSPRVQGMFNNRPRRRTSFAEIQMNHYSLPRPTIQRSVSQVSSYGFNTGGDEADYIPSYSELRGQYNRQNNFGNKRISNGATTIYGTIPRRMQRATSQPPAEGYTRVSVQRPQYSQDPWNDSELNCVMDQLH